MFYKFDTINRPLSPHLLIYSPQLSSLFSIWHRITGITLIILLTTILLGLKVMSILNFYSSIFIVQLFLVFSFSNWLLIYVYLFSLLILLYHAFNGIRHIIWDVGFLLNLKQLFLSSLLSLSIIFIILISNLFNI